MASRVTTFVHSKISFHAELTIALGGYMFRKRSGCLALFENRAAMFNIDVKSIIAYSPTKKNIGMQHLINNVKDKLQISA